MLRVDGRLAAFSIGEPICSNVFGVHIEKADTRYHGAYPAMAREFAAHFAMDYTYLNREEDLGIAGLRKSKLSYYPELLLENGQQLVIRRRNCAESLSPEILKQHCTKL